MRIYRNPFLFTMFVILLINSICGAEKLPDSNFVAKYGNGHSVTVKELNKYVVDWLYYKKFINKSDVYNNALNDMLVNQFKRMDFFERGLDKDSILIQGVRRIINEELVEEYYEKQYENKYVNEQYAKKIYTVMDKEVVYQVIELSIPENATQKQVDSLQEKASAIKSEIENGKNFTELVKKYSQNKMSAQTDGYMPPVGWKQSILDPVGSVIFNLKKNDIRIINSFNSLLIVKIINENKIPVEPFDSLKDEIISELKNSYSSTSREEFEKDKNDFINDTRLEWNQPALDQVVYWSNMPGFYKGGYQKTIGGALANGENKIILTYNEGTLDYNGFLSLLDNVLLMENADSIKEEDIKKFILEALYTGNIVKKAYSLDLLKNIFNPFTTNNILKNQIAYLYNQAVIETQIPGATEEALHSYFKENESTLYYQLEKRNIFLMIFSDKDQAGKVMETIKGGVPFEKVTGSYLVKTYVKERNGEFKSYLSNEMPIFAGTAFKMKESEVSGPEKFQDENNLTKYAVIKCYHIRPEKQLTFDDVKDVITEDYRSYHRKIIEKDTEEILKSKYHPVINEEVLTKLISAK